MSNHTKPHQIRGKITAGPSDIDSFRHNLHAFAASITYSVTFEHIRPRGSHGPLIDYTFGLTQTLPSPPY